MTDGPTYRRIIGAEITLETSKLKAGITKAQWHLQTLRKQFVAATADMDREARAVDICNERHDYLGKRLVQQKTILQNYGAMLQRVLDNENSTAQAVERAEQAYADAEGAVKRTTAEIERYSQSLAEAKAKQASLSKGFTVLKGVVTNLVTKAIYGLARAVKAGGQEMVDFEASLADVQKVSRASVEEIETLGWAMRNATMGAGKLPATATALNKIALSGARLGIAAKNLDEFSVTIQKLSDISTLGAEEAATMMARIGAITGLQVNQYERFASTLYRLANNFATTEGEVLTIALRLSGAAKLIGMSEQDMLSISAVMSAVGVEAERGGTAFTKLAKRIELAVSNGKGLGQIAAVAGKTAEAFKALWNANPTQALMAFLKGLKTIDEGGGSVIKTLHDLGWSEIRMTDMVQKLALAYEKLEGALNISNQAWLENTGLTEATEIQYETLKSQIAKLKAEWKTAAAEFAEPLKPAVQWGVNLGQSIAEALHENNLYQLINDWAVEHRHWPDPKEQLAIWGLEEPIRQRALTDFYGNAIGYRVFKKGEGGAPAYSTEEPIEAWWRQRFAKVGLDERFLPGTAWDKEYHEAGVAIRALVRDLDDLGSMSAQTLLELIGDFDKIVKKLEEMDVEGSKAGKGTIAALEGVRGKIENVYKPKAYLAEHGDSPLSQAYDKIKEDVERDLKAGVLTHDQAVDQMQKRLRKYRESIAAEPIKQSVEIKTTETHEIKIVKREPPQPKKMAAKDLGKKPEAVTTRAVPGKAPQKSDYLRYDTEKPKREDFLVQPTPPDKTAKEYYYKKEPEPQATEERFYVQAEPEPKQADYKKPKEKREEWLLRRGYLGAGRRPEAVILPEASGLDLPKKEAYLKHRLPEPQEADFTSEVLVGGTVKRTPIFDFEHYSGGKGIKAKPETLREQLDAARWLNPAIAGQYGPDLTKVGEKAKTQKGTEFTVTQGQADWYATYTGLVKSAWEAFEQNPSEAGEFELKSKLEGLYMGAAAEWPSVAPKGLSQNQGKSDPLLKLSAGLSALKRLAGRAASNPVEWEEETIGGRYEKQVNQKALEAAKKEYKASAYVDTDAYAEDLTKALAEQFGNKEFGDALGSYLAGQLTGREMDEAISRFFQGKVREDVAQAQKDMEAGKEGGTYTAAKDALDLFGRVCKATMTQAEAVDKLGKAWEATGQVLAEGERAFSEDTANLVDNVEAFDKAHKNWENAPKTQFNQALYDRVHKEWKDKPLAFNQGLYDADLAAYGAQEPAVDQAAFNQAVKEREDSKWFDTQAYAGDLAAWLLGQFDDKEFAEALAGYITNPEGRIQGNQLSAKLEQLMKSKASADVAAAAQDLETGAEGTYTATRDTYEKIQEIAGALLDENHALEVTQKAWTFGTEALAKSVEEYNAAEQAAAALEALAQKQKEAEQAAAAATRQISLEEAAIDNLIAASDEEVKEIEARVQADKALADEQEKTLLADYYKDTGAAREALEATYRPLTEIEEATADIAKLEEAITAAEHQQATNLAAELKDLKGVVQKKKEQLEADKALEAQRKREREEAEAARAAEEERRKAKEAKDRKRAEANKAQVEEYVRTLMKLASLDDMELLVRLVGDDAAREIKAAIQQALRDADLGKIELSEEQELKFNQLLTVLDKVARTSKQKPRPVNPRTEGFGAIRGQIAGWEAEKEEADKIASTAQSNVDFWDSLKKIYGAGGEKDYEAAKAAEVPNAAERGITTAADLFANEILGLLKEQGKATGQDITETQADISQGISRLGMEGYLAERSGAAAEIAEAGEKRSGDLQSQIDEARNTLEHSGIEWVVQMRIKEVDWKEKWAAIAEDLKWLWEKVEAGLGYIVEQIFAIAVEDYQQQIDAAEAKLDKLEKEKEEALKAAEEASEEEEEQLRAQLEGGMISQAEYYSKLDSLRKKSKEEKDRIEADNKEKEEQALREKNEAAEKLFHAQQANAIANIWISAAGAVMKAIEQLGPIAAIPVGVAIAALAGVQTWQVSRQQFTPLMAEGGVVSRPTHVIAGEAGAEAIIPLERNTEWMDILANRLASSIHNVYNGDTSSSTINNNGNTYQYDIQQSIFTKPQSKKDLYRATRRAIEYNIG